MIKPEKIIKNILGEKGSKKLKQYNDKRYWVDDIHGDVGLIVYAQNPKEAKRKFMQRVFGFRENQLRVRLSEKRKVRQLVQTDQQKRDAKLKSIAWQYNLSNSDTNDFIKFFNLMFPHNNDKTYMKTWARRIANRLCWQEADLASRRGLLKVNHSKYKMFEWAQKEGIYPDERFDIVW